MTCDLREHGNHIEEEFEFNVGLRSPHTEATFLHSREQIAKDFVGIPEKEIRMMVAENAAQLYGVK
jgi:hypothetical protein